MSSMAVVHIRRGIIKGSPVEKFHERSQSRSVGEVSWYYYTIVTGEFFLRLYLKTLLQGKLASPARGVPPRGRDLL